jgi:hypothetical protein
MPRMKARAPWPTATFNKPLCYYVIGTVRYSVDRINDLPKNAWQPNLLLLPVHD